jgi:DNA-binding MarR family transcriptional regulator
LLQQASRRNWPEPPLSPSQVRLLRLVRLCPGISPEHAAVDAREDGRFVTAVADQLVALDLLEVRRSGGDDPMQLRLTARGHARAAAWDGTRREVLDRALDRLAPQERAAIALALPALERLAFALDDC